MCRVQCVMFMPVDLVCGRVGRARRRAGPGGPARRSGSCRLALVPSFLLSSSSYVSVVSRLHVSNAWPNDTMPTLTCKPESRHHGIHGRVVRRKTSGDVLGSGPPGLELSPGLVAACLSRGGLRPRGPNKGYTLRPSLNSAPFRRG